MSTSKRGEKGRNIIGQLQGGIDRDQIFGVIEEVFPDFLKITEEHLFGNVWSRAGLPLRDRCMITLAILIVIRYGDDSYSGFHDQVLKAHMGYALNIGISQEEILEVIMHAANYTCWGAGYEAIRAAKDVFSSKQ